MLRLEEEQVKFFLIIGVFCFIDFVSYVLRYITDKIARDIFSCNKNKLFQDEEFSNFVKNDFKLIYFSTFSDEESSVYHNICEKLQNLDLKFKLNIFKYIVRFSNKNNTRWDTNYLANVLAPYKTSITKTYICGPTRFLDDIKQSLIDGLIVPIEKIYLV